MGRVVQNWVPLHCHFRESGNPGPQHVRPSLNARFCGHDTCGSTQTPHFERPGPLVGRVVENEPFPSPRLFAGRGRVRGLGEWPHLFIYAPVLLMTMCFIGQSCGFKQSGYSPRPLTLPLPAKRRGEGNIPSF
jgi:hypothetical protein